MYKLQKSFRIDGTIGEPVAVIRLSDNAVIPFDPANTDYQQYLKWLDEGGVPLPAEETQ
jgi:hypothetical protein